MRDDQSFLCPQQNEYILSLKCHHDVHGVNSTVVCYHYKQGSLENMNYLEGKLKTNK